MNGDLCTCAQKIRNFNCKVIFGMRVLWTSIFFLKIMLWVFLTECMSVYLVLEWYPWRPEECTGSAKAATIMVPAFQPIFLIFNFIIYTFVFGCSIAVF